MCCPSVDMLDAELEDYRSAHPLAAVMPLIRRLLIDEAEEAGAIVVVADADARLLWVEGDAALRRLAEGMNWVAGSRWDERTTGTNAPAAAMRLDHALQVFAREHYASNVAAWSCTAAPIHDPITGRVLGALDITGRDDVAAPAVLSLVRAAVAAAESELHLLAMRPTQQRRGPARRRARQVSPKAVAEPKTAVAQVMSVLGRDRALLTAESGGPSTELSVRHSELLFLLSQHTEGYTADQLAIALHERDVPAVTVRAELSRLRSLLPGLGLSGRPYRITATAADRRRCRPRPGWRPTISPARSPVSRADPAVIGFARGAGRAGPAAPRDPFGGLAFERRGSRAGIRQQPCSREDALVWRHAITLADPATRPVLIEHLRRIERELGA